MIDFRYHLVSIVAIFLSLAVGLILGATTLSDPLLGRLKKEAAATGKTNEELRARQRQLEKQIKGEEQFSQVLGPQIVTGRLRGQSVVLVETPGAGQDSLDKVGELAGAKYAGATVTGRVTIQKKFLDDDQAEYVSQLADQLKPAGTTFPSGAGPYDKAGAVLASALVTKDAAKAGRDDTSGAAIIEAFKTAGFVTVSGKPGQHATLAVMAAPSTPYQDGADIDNKALISVASALDKADRGTVIAGPTTAATGDGLIAALRDSGAEENVSSVDTLDTSSGQVVTILALENEMANKAGQYGTGDGASTYLPTPAPLPGVSG